MLSELYAWILLHGLLLHAWSLDDHKRVAYLGDVYGLCDLIARLYLVGAISAKLAASMQDKISNSYPNTGVNDYVWTQNEAGRLARMEFCSQQIEQLKTLKAKE